MIRPGSYRRWLFAGVLLVGAGLGVRLGLRWIAPEPGTFEEVFAHVRVGMTGQEALAVLRTYAPGDAGDVYLEGTDDPAHSFYSHGWGGRLSDDARPAWLVTPSVVRIVNVRDRELSITFGPDGTVSDKRLSPSLWEDRLERLSRGVDNAKTDLLSTSWWQTLRRKTWRSIWRRWPLVASLAAGLFIAGLWAWSRRRSLRAAGPSFRNVGNVALQGEKEVIYETSHRAPPSLHPD